MIQKRLGGSRLVAAAAVILCGSVAGYAAGHALGQHGDTRGNHQQPRVTSIQGLLGQAILSLPAQQQAPPPRAPAAQPASPPAHTQAATEPSKHHGKDGDHGKGGGKGGGDGGGAGTHSDHSRQDGGHGHGNGSS